MPKKRPSPSMAVAIVALVFAVAGTAVASVATISVLNKKEKQQTRNIARNEISNAAPGLSVAKAADADKLGGQGISSFLHNGDAAGGDLTGTYPDPTIKSSAIPPAQSQELGGSIGNVPTNLTYFLAPAGLTTPNQQAVNVSLGVSATPLTISNFSATVSVAPGPTTNGWEFGWIINGGSLVFACQFFDPATSCTDSSTHQVPAGATLALQVSPVNAPTTARVTFGWTASS